MREAPIFLGLAIYNPLIDSLFSSSPCSERYGSPHLLYYFLAYTIGYRLFHLYQLDIDTGQTKVLLQTTITVVTWMNSLSLVTVLLEAVRE